MQSELTSKLPGLISRCRMFAECRYFKPTGKNSQQQKLHYKHNSNADSSYCLYVSWCDTLPQCLAAPLPPHNDSILAAFSWKTSIRQLPFCFLSSLILQKTFTKKTIKKIKLEAIQRWLAICRVWPIKNSFCAFLARVKTYTHTKN